VLEGVVLEDGALAGAVVLVAGFCAGVVEDWGVPCEKASAAQAAEANRQILLFIQKISKL
jgi:hypothetical protein